MAFSIFVFVKVQFEAKGLEICSYFIQCTGVVFRSTVLPQRGGGMKKKTVVTYETALHSEKFAEFQRQALVECPAFLGYRGCRGFH